MQSYETPERAFTLIDVLVVVAILAILASLMPCACGRSKARAQRVSCLSNLKHIGLAFREYSNGHGDQFPWQVPLNQTGSLEFAQSSNVYRHFLAASNEMASPRILACRSDGARTPIADWRLFSNSNLSYFINLDADEGKPQTILAGDRNIVGGTAASGVLRTFSERSKVGWTKDMHRRAGNIVLADGSAQQMGNTNIIGPARLLIP
jgi:prepilin-type N-terminal cleavage/methylation domain-containing protein